MFVENNVTQPEAEDFANAKLSTRFHSRMSILLCN